MAGKKFDADSLATISKIGSRLVFRFANAKGQAMSIRVPITHAAGILGVLQQVTATELMKTTAKQQDPNEGIYTRSPANFDVGIDHDKNEILLVFDKSLPLQSGYQLTQKDARNLGERLLLVTASSNQPSDKPSSAH